LTAQTTAKQGRGRRASSARPRSVLKAKGLRTRAAIKEAARDVLNEKGFRQIRLQDVAERAGVSPSVLYRYFRDLRSVVAELAEDLFEDLREAGKAQPATEDPYEWILFTLNDAVQHLGKNPGILGCLFGLAGDYQEFDDIWKKNAHTWNLRVAGFLTEQAGFARIPATNMAYALGAVTEGIIYQTYIRHTEDLAAFSGSAQDTAELIATIWYRTIFLENPPRDKTSRVTRQLTEK
jgi:AcrR family transcriptional regulator